MSDIRDISDVPTPRVPLMRGEHVSREWIMFFQKIKDAFSDTEGAIETAGETYWKHFFMMGA